MNRLNRSLLVVATAFASIVALTSSASAGRATLSAMSTPHPSPVKIILKGVHQVRKPAGADLPVMARSGGAGYVKSGGAGYVVTARPDVAFTSVKTYFTVPSITGCTGGAFHLASLDGVNSPDFEQAGVYEYGCNGVTTADMMFNVFNYGAFYFGSVNPGDAIMAMVSVDKSQQYVMQVNDLTTGAELAVTLGCQESSCPNGTAEVGVEGDGTIRHNEADFTMVNFTGSSVTATSANTHSPISGSLAAKPGCWSSSELYDIANGKPLTEVSRLYGGRAFTVTWKSYF